MYSNKPNLNRKPSPLRYVVLVLICILVVGTLLSAVTLGLRIPTKIKTTYSNPVKLEDNLNVFDQSDALMNAVQKFYETTGIPVTIVTGDNSWKDNYNSLENYAYDLYVQRYTDEDHWVIVYTTDGAEDFERWYFEGMQGDNTDDILTREVTDKFNTNLTKYIMNANYSESQAFAQAFSDIMPGIMKVEFHPGFTLASIPGMLPWLTFLFILYHSLSNTAYKDYIQCPDDNVVNPRDNEASCEYCNGTYYIGSVTSCPHCGAPIRSKT